MPDATLSASRRTAPVVAAAAALYLVLSLVLSFWVAGPALDGDFLSDDHFYITNNPYVHALSSRNLRDIVDPFGPAAAMTLNYAPVHLLAHAIEWRVFGNGRMQAWHAVNAVAHALVALALAALLVQSGIPPPAAALGGAFFVVHPANVEVVAWIFQLKTALATGLALTALLLRRRHPGWALSLFSLALLAKVTALFALPAAAVGAWVDAGPGRRAGDAAPAHARWLLGWLAVSLALVVPEIAAFGQQGEPAGLATADLGVRFRTAFALAARYGAMALTATGLSTFHEPVPARSLLDPWWLAGLALVALLGVRTVASGRRRDPECMYWVMAAASFAPVSQIFAFQNALGDRYLYGILPGLVGGVLIAGRPVFAKLSQRFGRRAAARGLALAAIAWIAVLAVRAHDRAPVFRSDEAMAADAALHYPLGLSASLMGAERAARAGDAQAAARAMSRAVDLGFGDLSSLLRSPVYAPVRTAPAFSAVMARIAEYDVAHLAPRDRLFPFQRFQLALAYNYLGQREQALVTLEPALTEDDPFQPVVRALYDALSGRGR